MLVAGVVRTGVVGRRAVKVLKILSREEEAKTALVVFQPSGRRGRFPIGMPVLQAARKMGVYLESVCGGRGLCGRCQIIVTTGTFAKYGITSRDDHLSPIEKHENDYRNKRFLGEDRRLGCSALIYGDLVINIPSEARSNRQVIRKRAENRRIERDLITLLCCLLATQIDCYMRWSRTGVILHFPSILAYCRQSSPLSGRVIGR